MPDLHFVVYGKTPFGDDGRIEVMAHSRVRAEEIAMEHGLIHPMSIYVKPNAKKTRRREPARPSGARALGLGRWPASYRTTGKKNGAKSKYTKRAKKP